MNVSVELQTQLCRVLTAAPGTLPGTHQSTVATQRTAALVQAQLGHPCFLYWDNNWAFATMRFSLSWSVVEGMLLTCC